MKVKLQVSSYAGGVVATLTSGPFQLGQSKVFRPDDSHQAVEDAVENLIDRILGEKTGATRLPAILAELCPKGKKP